MVYYKIVQLVGNGIYSMKADSCNTDGAAHIVKYGHLSLAVQPIVKPKIPNSKLYVFNTLDNALAFLAFDITYYDIWECEAPKGKPASIICDWFAPWRIERFWVNEERTHIVNAPAGTIMVDSLQLTKRIYYTSQNNRIWPSPILWKI